jgi:hypothetical protein
MVQDALFDEGFLTLRRISEELLNIQASPSER